MCSWMIQKSPDRQKTCLVSKVKTRRMRATTLEIKVISVCLGIEHMIKRRKMASELKPFDNNHHYRVCRLCQSTKRVLRITRVHGRQKRVGCNCEACWMWSMVKARCTSLGLDISAVMDENALDGGVAASAADTSRPAVPFEGLGSSYK